MSKVATSKTETLKVILRSGNSIQKINTLIYIMENHIKFPIRYLHDLLYDSDKKVQSTAAFVLSKLGNKSSIKYLLNLWSVMNNKHTHLKRQILIALIDIGGIKSLKKISPSFSHWHVSLQELVIEYIAQTKNEKIISSFITGLKGQKPNKKMILILKKNNIIWK